MTGEQTISVNARAAALVERLKADRAELKVGVARGSLGETLIDAGSRQPGGIAAGLRLAAICMGGLGTVELVPDSATPRWPWTIAVASSHPVIACLASQYAGWNLAHGEGQDAFFALGSGPARSLARTEPLFEKLAYKDDAATATLVMESSRPPPAPVVAKVARECGLEPKALTFIYAPTQSLGSRCTKPTRSDFRSSVSSRAWGRLRSPRRIRTSSPPWAAPTMRSSTRAASTCS